MFKNFILQTLNSISAEKNNTVIFPLPIDLITRLLHGENKEKDIGEKKKEKCPIVEDKFSTIFSNFISLPKTVKQLAIKQSIQFLCFHYSECCGVSRTCGEKNPLLVLGSDQLSSAVENNVYTEYCKSCILYHKRKYLNLPNFGCRKIKTFLLALYLECCITCSFQTAII